MKRYRPEQVAEKLRQADVELGKGLTVPEICRAIEVSQQTYYRWRQKYGGMSPELVKELKTLQKEDQRLRKQALTKRKSELVGMQDRLLNGYLAGAMDQAVFQSKAADLKREIAQAEEALERATLCDAGAPTRALALFDFSQRPGRSGTVQTRRSIGRFWTASV